MKDLDTEEEHGDFKWWRGEGEKRERGVGSCRKGIIVVERARMASAVTGASVKRGDKGPHVHVYQWADIDVAFMYVRLDVLSRPLMALRRKPQTPADSITWTFPQIRVARTLYTCPQLITPTDFTDTRSRPYKIFLVGLFRGTCASSKLDLFIFKSLHTPPAILPLSGDPFYPNLEIQAEEANTRRLGALTLGKERKKAAGG